jgi:hypothetical protein
LPGAIHTNLAIGRVDNPVEHEANRLAEQAMRISGPKRPLSAMPPHLSSTCTTCKLEAQVRPTESAEKPDTGEVPASVHEALRSPGQPLDTHSRGFFEPRFGRDFSNVRVHADAIAAESARSIGALAYSVGSSIVFGAALYQPKTRRGRELLAHELAHVVQPPASVGLPPTIRRQDAGTTAGGVSLEDRALQPASKEIIRAMERVDPEASGGVGDFAAAFRILNGLPMYDMLATLDELQRLGEFGLLQDNIVRAVGVNRPRIEVAMAAVRDRGIVTIDRFIATQGDAFSTLPLDQQENIRTFFPAVPPAPSRDPDANVPMGGTYDDYKSNVDYINSEEEEVSAEEVLDIANDRRKTDEAGFLVLLGKLGAQMVILFASFDITAAFPESSTLMGGSPALKEWDRAWSEFDRTRRSGFPGTSLDPDALAFNEVLVPDPYMERFIHEPRIGPGRVIAAAKRAGQSEQRETLLSGLAAGLAGLSAGRAPSTPGRTRGGRRPRAPRRRSVGTRPIPRAAPNREVKGNLGGPLGARKAETSARGQEVSARGENLNADAMNRHYGVTVQSPENEPEFKDRLAAAKQRDGLSAEKNPDHLVQGPGGVWQVWDSATGMGDTLTAESALKTIGDKVGKGQAVRIVLNLDGVKNDGRTFARELMAKISEDQQKPASHQVARGVKQVVIVKGGVLFSVFP